MKINRPELIKHVDLENGSVYIEKGQLLMKIDDNREVNLETGMTSPVQPSDMVHWLKHATLYPEDKP